MISSQEQSTSRIQVNRTKEFLASASLILLFTILGCGLYIFTLHKQIGVIQAELHKTTQTSFTPSPTPVSKNPDETEPLLYVSQSEPDPSGQFSAYLSVLPEKDQTSYKISFRVGVKRNESLVITKDNYKDTSINLNLPNNNPYTQFLLDNHKQIGYLRDDQYSNAFEWSNDGESLAVYLEDKIILWKFKYIDNYKDTLKTTETSTQTAVYKRALEIIEKKEIVHLNTPKSGNVRLFFSGNDEFLYYNDDSGRLYQYSMNDYQQQILSLEPQSHGLFPVANTSGYVTWMEKQGINGNNMLKIFNGQSNQTYTIPNSSKVDGVGKVVFSPTGKYVCLEWGSSGYWGYAVYSIPSMQSLDGGDQYSYCRNWRDDSKLIIIEDPYGGSGTSWVEVNVATGEKQIIDHIDKNLTLGS